MIPSWIIEEIQKAEKQKESEDNRPTLEIPLEYEKEKDVNKEEEFVYQV